MRVSFNTTIAGILAITIAGACSPAGDGESSPAAARDDGRADATLDSALDRIIARTDSIADALKPVPLLTGAEESSLRRYLNAEHLEAARRLGIQRPENSAELEALVEDGSLVVLEDSTQYWVVRELDHSVALVTPDTRSLLTEIGERFQAELHELGIPPYRLDVTSVLRTAESQADLRQANPNAAAGVSTHEFGTTLDVAYSSFPAPAEPVVDLGNVDPTWLAPHLERVADAIAESVAARKSRELQAILGRVLQEMQQEGSVMVTLERRQPVYHLTVAKNY
ncbi:MAG TPA: DUF5715 family protein [Longimicrobiaceae bacterium]|nr:DUF5715 family protein [Longimicrobiaceae bacterium]